MINKNNFLMLSRRDYDAGIFALDGVIAPTACGLDNRRNAPLFLDSLAQRLAHNSAGLPKDGAEGGGGSLSQAHIAAGDEAPRADPNLSSALGQLEAIKQMLGGKKPAVFLDYDGTLTPIVARPELAVLSAPMREVLEELAACCLTAIVSGRDLEDVRRLVALNGLYYAGSHGFDITGPQHTRIEYQEGRAFLPDLAQAAAQLNESLGTIPGCLIERKRFAIAVHYRLVADQHLETVRAAVERIVAQHSRLRRSGGKKIYELRPNVDWNKGRALLWLLEALKLNTPDVLPIYIGDDETDEDAFAAVEGRGIGILVAAQPQPSRARYRLADTGEVMQFLKALVTILKTGHR